jgi:hypothetical protein
MEGTYDEYLEGSEGEYLEGTEWEYLEGTEGNIWRVLQRNNRMVLWGNI